MCWTRGFLHGFGLFRPWAGRKKPRILKNFIQPRI